MRNIYVYKECDIDEPYVRYDAFTNEFEVIEHVEVKELTWLHKYVKELWFDKF